MRFHFKRTICIISLSLFVLLAGCGGNPRGSTSVLSASSTPAVPSKSLYVTLQNGLTKLDINDGKLLRFNLQELA